MPEQRRRFSPQRKAEAVQMVLETGKPIAEVARDLGINEGTLGNWGRVQGCCKVPIHAPDLLKRARRSARSESRQRSWRRQADRHIALTSEPSTARHAGGPPDRWLG